MKYAVDKANKFGIGACLLTNATHWGRAFAYAFRAAQAGTIGICMTNAIPNMIAWQSRHALLGNNPLGIGIPQKDKEPIVLDMAMSQAAYGKIGTYAREGKEIPPGWGVDADGGVDRCTFDIERRQTSSLWRAQGIGTFVHDRTPDRRTCRHDAFARNHAKR